MSNNHRVLRVIEYVGSREWIEDTLKKGCVPADGCKVIGKNIIKSCLIDKFPEKIEDRKGNMPKSQELEKFKKTNQDVSIKITFDNNFDLYPSNLMEKLAEDIKFGGFQ